MVINTGSQKRHHIQDEEEEIDMRAFDSFQERLILFIDPSMGTVRGH